MCLDVRGLNKLTVANNFPIPHIEELLDQLQGAKVFTAFDLAQGYNQLLLSPEEQERTAFKTPFGVYQWKVLFFGARNGPAYFSETMRNIFHEAIGKFVLIYLDDIICFSKDAVSHEQHVQWVLDKLREHRLYACRPKCHFNLAEVTYLGHIVSAEGVKVDPVKTKCVDEWPTPRNAKELRSFLGLANYFRRFMQGYSKLVSPLTDLMKSDAKWLWSFECQRAFDGVKSALTSAPVLAMPDFTKPFEMISDASGDAHRGALGAVLMQEGRVIAYESRKLTKAEFNYTTTEQEMLGVVYDLHRWRCYLEGLKFTVITDHNPNVYFETKTLLNRRQARWAEFLADFDCVVREIRPGRNNVADPVSRIPSHAPTMVLAVLGCARESSPRPHESTEKPVMSDPFTPLVARLVAGYASDPWFGDKENLATLRAESGLYFLNHSLVVPDAYVKS